MYVLTFIFCFNLVNKIIKYHLTKNKLTELRGNQINYYINITLRTYLKPRKFYFTRTRGRRGTTDYIICLLIYTKNDFQVPTACHPGKATLVAVFLPTGLRWPAQYPYREVAYLVEC